MTSLSLDEVTITGTDRAPVTESVRLHGPPGTGKTTESAARVATLLEEHDYELHDVAWATYRRSLAADTVDRLVEWGVIDDEHHDSKLSEGATRYLGTMHALGRRTYGDMGQPATGWEKKDFCDDRGIRYFSNQPYTKGPGEKLFALFDWLKGNLLDPSEADDVREYPRFHDLSDRWTAEAVAELWGEWQGYKVRHDLCDFHEMLERPLQEGRVPPCDIVVVDEFHDATPLMASLAQQWIDAADIAIVAGDPHQVINGYDGASPAFFEDLDLTRVLLDRSYRVPHEHLALAFSILSTAHTPPGIQPEGDGLIREYQSGRFTPGSAGHWEVPQMETAGSPPQLVQKHGGSTMFLTRTRMQAGGVAFALDKAGYPYLTLSGESGWGKESKRLELYNALTPLTPFDAITVGAVDKSGLSKYGSTESGADPATTRIDGNAAARLLTTIPRDYIDVSASELKDMARKWRLESTTGPTVDELTPLVTPEFWDTWTAGAASVSRFGDDVLTAQDKMALRATMQRFGDPIDATEIDTRVLTIHASKGMEADDVVLYDGITQSTQQGIRRSEELAANEARTWYVATTRANKRLHIMRDAFGFAAPFLPSNLGMAVDDFMDDVAAD